MRIRQADAAITDEEFTTEANMAFVMDARCRNESPKDEP